MTTQDQRTLNLPDDTDLPFFAYGIFKPGQLAYSKIKNHVQKYQNDVELNYEMRIRDGVPILVNKKRDYYTTKGTLITFKRCREKKAYDIISKTLLNRLYEWQTIEIENRKVNLLFGVNPDAGSNHIEIEDERKCYDGKKDPFFSDAINLIERNLNSERNIWNPESFFDLQMNYMLLWSAIDRYSSIKYNRRYDKWNRKKFAKEPAFKKGIEKFAQKRHYRVFSTNDLIEHNFNADNAYETLMYYYTFRCNVVHRGKAMSNDYSMLRTATEELLELFKAVLEDTFDGQKSSLSK